MARGLMSDLLTVIVKLLLTYILCYFFNNKHIYKKEYKVYYKNKEVTTWKL